MNTDELNRKWNRAQEQIRTLEAEREAIAARGEPVPGRIRWRLAEARIQAEEARLWGHREFVRTVREMCAWGAGSARNDEK
jgi:hypothetical protein